MASSQPAQAESDPLTTLRASATNAQNLTHAGDITPAQAFSYLQASAAILIDVRTPEEWSAGVPDLSGTQGSLLKLSWRLSGNYDLNPAFKEQLLSHIENVNDPVLIFMCKGGGRSLEAANVMAMHGYANCFNVLGGYEGKGNIPGWKTIPLPSNRG